MRSQGSIFVLVALLLAFIVMGVPTTANAVEGTLQLFDVVTGAALTPVGNFGSINQLSVSLGADYRFPPTDITGQFCANPNLCVSIKNGSKLSYTSGTGTQALGVLAFSPLVVQNLSTQAVVLVVKYGHTNTAVITSSLCSGMSLSGFFSDANGVDSADFATLSSTVTWLNCNQQNCNTPFKIGSQSLAPCPNTVQASSTPSLLQASASTDLTFGPANPPQVLNLIPQPCNNCSAVARIDNIYQARLGVGDSIQQVGTLTTLTQRCGATKNSPFCDPDVNANPDYTKVLLPELMDWVVPNNSVPLKKGGDVLSTVFDNGPLKSTDVDYHVGGNPVLSVMKPDGTLFPGAPLKSVSCKPGECDLHHDVSFLTDDTNPQTGVVELACNTSFLVLTGTLRNGTIPFTASAPITVNCQP
jgi:hypothetical protein